MPQTETIVKEINSHGVYLRRTVAAEDGATISDERVKRDPVLAFTQPPPVTIDETTLTALVTVSLQLQDFDGELRTDTGIVQFRFRDRALAYDEGVTFTRQLTAGQLVLSMEFDTPGQFVITLEPPLVSDLQLSEPIRVTVT